MTVKPSPRLSSALPVSSLPGLPSLTRWCRARITEHLDDCGEVDVTSLALACAREHGTEDPGEHSPVWEAASRAAADWEDSREQVRGRREK